LLSLSIKEMIQGKLHIRIMLLLCIAAGSSVFAQQQSGLEPVFGMTNNCEDAKARLDGVAIESGKEGFIILVARLGDGETSRKLNRQRISYILRYFNRENYLGEHRLIRAEGERVSGPGRVEIYAKGKLMLILTTRRNGDVLGDKSCPPQ
jgi:hypothetical protein